MSQRRNFGVSTLFPLWLLVLLLLLLWALYVSSSPCSCTLLGVFWIVQSMGLVAAGELAARLLFSLGATSFLVVTALLYFMNVGDKVASPSQAKGTISSTSLASRSFSEFEVVAVVTGDKGGEDELRKWLKCRGGSSCNTTVRG